MSNLNENIKSRRSIRKFTDTPVSDDVINEIITSACYAPSACNSQCWKFIVLKDKEMISKLSDAVTKGFTCFYDGFAPDENFLSSRINHATFFRNAPVVICVFMTRMSYHDKRVEDIFSSKGYSHHEMLLAMGEPDVLTIGAAIQNILLTIHNKGLGACWMNDPIIANLEICKLLNTPNDARLMSIIPVGYPAYSPRDKQIKPLSEILTIL